MKKKALFTALTLGGLLLTLTGCGDKTQNQVRSPADLPGKTIGVQFGTVGDYFATEFESPQDDSPPAVVERFNKSVDAIQALKLGKLDCMILDKHPATKFVENNDDLKILETPFVEENYAIAVSKDNSELKEEINEALSQLREDGTLDAIISFYIDDGTIGEHAYLPDETVKRNGKTLKMATHAFFAPYEYYQNSKLYGIDVDLAQAICDKLGYDLKIIDMEFDTIIDTVNSGKADFGMSAMTITEERQKIIDFSDSYTNSTQVIITRKQ